MLAALNAPNSRSWINTFSLDKDGDLQVSAYIALPHRLTGADITDFLERASQSLLDVIRNTEMKDFVK